MGGRARRATAVGPGIEEVVVIALAAARVARAISVDEISAPLRARLEQAASQDGRRAARVLADLVRCPVCTGWWVSLGVSALWPGTYRFRRALSVAGVQVLITLAERLVSEEGEAAVLQTEGR